ncbi:MAG: ABC transporter permease subunit [Deltaproteobacteria bacterium]|nr:ABC transporter permease subunit [Deltaproteobacteria bacterium]
MGQILAIAGNSFKDSVRSRVMLGVFFLAIVMIVSSLVLGALSFGEERKITADWGLFCTSLFGVIITIVVGIQQIHKEIDKKTLYNVLAKPVSRSHFLFGKYLGTMSVAVASILIMAIVHQGLMLESTGTFEPRLLIGVLADLLMVMILASVATFFSSVASPFMAGLFTTGFFLAGRWLHEMKYLILQLSRMDSAFAHYMTWPLKGLYLALPNFAIFDIDGELVHQIALPNGYLLLLAGYSITYSAVLLLAAVRAFSKRDFL